MQKKQRAINHVAIVCRAYVFKLPMTLDECRASGQTFSMPLKIKIQLINWDKDEAGKKIVRDIKEQDIFFADFPVMSDIYEEDGRYKLVVLVLS